MQLVLVLTDPELWKALTVTLIIVVLVGEFLAGVFPYER